MMQASTFAYVSNRESREILVLRLDTSTGELTETQRMPVNGAVMPMAVSPDRRFLYAALRTEPYAVASFAIDPLSGALTHLVDTPLPASMTYISTDHSGRFLLAAANPWGGPRPRNSLMAVSAISRQGFLQLPQQVIRTPQKTHAILPGPANRHVFMTSCDEDKILWSRFDAATGIVGPEAPMEIPVQAGAGPRHFVFHPNNRYLYLVTEYAGHLYTFSHDPATGALAELQVTEIIPPDPSGKSLRACDLHFAPDGRFLYVSERHTDTLVTFGVDAVSGRVARLGSVPTEKEPRGFNITPCGRYLLAVGRLSHSMTSYAIDRASGRLTELKKYPMGQGPNWVEIVSLP